MKKLRLAKLISCFLIFAACGSKYENFEAGKVFTLQVNFSDQNRNKRSTICLFSVPNKYSPHRAWPLVVALHGYGDHAAAFHDLWQSVTDSMGFVLLTPQGEDRTKEGFGWAWGKNAERSVEISIDIVRKAIHIDHKRIYLTGFSAGGALTYVMGLKYPQVFRGIAPLGAPFKREFMSENTKRFQVLETFRNLRVYIGLRALEKRFLSDAHLAVEVFRDLGAKVEFVSYEGVGHGLPEPKKNELIRILTFLDSKK